jgi:hypothetical protein
VLNLGLLHFVTDEISSFVVKRSLVSIFFRLGAWRRLLIISLDCIIFFMFSDCSKIGNKCLASKSYGHLYLHQRRNRIQLKSGIESRANLPMDCKSQNLIYCAIFQTCDQFYIGQTNKSNARVRVHKQQIRDQSVRNTPCCEHFANCRNGKFILFPFYKLPNDNENIRLAEENYFIRLFKPKLNRKWFSIIILCTLLISYVIPCTVLLF